MATIVFDLDGTLVDTAADLIASLNCIAVEAGLEPFGDDHKTYLVGQGSRIMIARAFALRDCSLAEDDLDRLHAKFVQHYSAGMPGQSVEYDGVDEALDRLAANGCRFAVCTNKDEALAVTLLDKLGLRHRFEVVTGGDTFAFKKPDGRHILQTIAKVGGVPERSVMVGDSRNDVMAAKNAAVPSICVTFGYSDVPVSQLSPDGTISHFSELTLEFLDKLITERIG